VPVPSVSPQSASHNQTIPKPAKFSHAQANRERLLRRVRSFWITGVLEQSLHRTALLTLGLQEQPDAVANPWRLVIQESERAGTPLPAGTRITEVYYEAHGELLILGSPGAGKTTLLLELARDLLNRAEQETARPIPVVFNLSSWTRKQSSLAAWLIEELETKYQVPRKVGSDWINADQILPLLDGLDEVDATSRAACMQAINEYHQAHPLVPLVVCCRVNEYTALTNRLALFRAVAIQPLTTEQVNEYLVRIDEQVASLRVAFQNDPVLQKLVTTPLMLSILVMTYKGSSLEEIEGDASAEVRRRQIFATYTQRMLRRRSANSRYGPQQTLHWLSFLARQMKRQSQSVFFLERMQPDWVPKNRRQQIFSALIAGLVSILLFGLSAVLIFGLTGVFFGSQYQSHMIRVSGISSSLSSQSRICIMDGNNPDKQVCGPWEESYGRSCTLLDGNSEICAWQESPSRACLSEDNNPDSEVCISREDGPGQGVCLFESNNPDSQVCISQDGSRFLFLSRGTIPSGIAIPMSTGTVQGGVTSALLFGFLSILIGGMTSIRKRSIHPVEVVKWQWTGRRRRLLMGLLIGLGLGLLIGELLGLLSWIIDALLYTQGRSLDFTEAITGYLHYYPIPMQGFLGLRDALLFGGTGLLLGGVTSRMSHELMDEHIHTTPNEGIHRSVRYAVVSGLIILLVAGGSIGLSTGQPTEGLFFGLVAGIVTGLSNGGLACIRHLLLRVRLWYARVVPWNYPSFLDYAVERILLRKVGGGYIFMHRLLLEYFADVETGATP
jgi:DNA polymerase III delta prime subunit